jgi:hypothetical protein
VAASAAAVAADSAAAVAVVAAVAAAAVGPISPSSTISFFSAIFPNGLGYYRFSYNGSNRPYVGVMAQEVQTVMPKAVVRDRDGSLHVLYDRLGVRFQTYEEWIASGGRVPVVAPGSR